MIGIFVCFLMVFIVIFNESCRNLNNLLACNTAIVTASLFINNFIVAFYGFREEWAENQPLCVFRGYVFIASSVTICWSYTAQAIGRLFSTIFYKKKHLRNYRVYWFMIVLNWILGPVLSVGPIFIDDGYTYEKESRLCTLTTQRFRPSAYVVIPAFVVPLASNTIIYGLIIRHASSSRRVIPLAANQMTTAVPNMKREMKVARNMFIILTIFAFGGSPFLILDFWHHFGSPNTIPEPFYLFVMQTVTVSVNLSVCVLFRSDKHIKDIAFRYINHQYTRRATVTRSQRPTLPQNTG